LVLCNAGLNSTHWRLMKSQVPPWQPLYSIERDGINEISVSGIIAATAGFDDDKLFLETGDADYVLWTRSVLKPFQLASHLQILQESYPSLRPEHYALMSSSHNCEALHLQLLHEIMEIGRVSADQLLCPPAWPGDVWTRENFKLAGQHPQSLYHNCSGKHFSYLMSLQAQGKRADEYTDFDNVEHKRLEQLLSRILGRSENSFRKTTDGCQMPNHAMSVREMATLYRRLAFASGQCAANKDAQSNGTQSSGATISDDDKALGSVGNLMHQYPSILGGRNRLDSKIMHGSGSGTTSGATKFIAKDGADGLLAIGVLPTERFINGLGMVIKLSSGYDIRNMEAIAFQILKAVGLSHPMHEDVAQSASQNSDSARVRTDHLKTEFAFKVNEAVLAAGGMA
jgi:L-asparaginase II